MLLAEKSKVIPRGAVYLQVNKGGTFKEFKEGEEFPIPRMGDRFQLNEMHYCFGGRQVFVENAYGPDFYKWDISEMQMGWGVVANDKSLSKFTPVLDEIAGYPLLSMDGTYEGCYNLVDASDIKVPATVKSAKHICRNCEKLEAPIDFRGAINLKSLSYGFENCKSLTTMPDLKNCTELMEINFAFQNCQLLTEIKELPSSVLLQIGAFDNTNIKEKDLANDLLENDDLSVPETPSEDENNISK